MRKIVITPEIKQQVEKIIEQFNNTELDLISDFYSYFATYKNKFIYLKIQKEDVVYPAGRLTYNGNLNDLEFAIYKFSSEKYDGDEFMFPGSQHLDGSVKGALYACNTAYPPN